MKKTVSLQFTEEEILSIISSLDCDIDSLEYTYEDTHSKYFKDCAKEKTKIMDRLEKSLGVFE